MVVMDGDDDDDDITSSSAERKLNNCGQNVATTINILKSGKNDHRIQTKVKY